MRRISPIFNIALFAATVASVLWVGPATDGPVANITDALKAHLPFTAALLSILLAHEMGHFLLARRHGVDATWPFFIPAPIPPPFGFVGTFGAFIRVRSHMPTRRAVFEIGAAGPIAGFALALPLLWWGFAHSSVVTVPADASNPNLQSPLALLIAWLRGLPLHADRHSTIFGDSLITWLMARLTHGPLAPGTDLDVHPVAIAAWLGLFVTAINLIPVGQLDGGHVLYALLGPRAEPVARAVSWVLLGLGLAVSWNWIVWWAVARFVVGPRHPPTLDDRPLTRGQRAFAIATLAVLALTFTPVPFAM